MNIITFLLTVFLGFSLAHGRILVEDPAKGLNKVAKTKRSGAKTGEFAARKYFIERKSSSSNENSSFSGSSERYLSIHFGGFINDKQYRWGAKDRETDIGEIVFAVTYRIGEWVDSMDLLFRGEFSSYDIDKESPVKLSLMPILSFPDAASGFPLFFGVGAGLGVFF